MRYLILPAIIVLVVIVEINAGERRSDKGLEFGNGNSLNVVFNDAAPPDSLLTIDEIKANVELNQSQAVSIDSILTDASSKLQGVTDPGAQGDQAKAQIINNAYDAIRSVLTEEQRTKFDSLVAMKNR